MKPTNKNDDFYGYSKNLVYGLLLGLSVWNGCSG